MLKPNQETYIATKIAWTTAKQNGDSYVAWALFVIVREMATYFGEIIP